MLIYSFSSFGSPKKAARKLQITLPENIDYNGLFDDLFSKYTCQNEITKVRTTNMGSLYQLTYNIVMKDVSKEKEFIDNLRCRNGNLDISCSLMTGSNEEL